MRFLIPRFASLLTACVPAALVMAAPSSPLAVMPEQPVELFPLSAVRLLEGPFTAAVEANRDYLLAHEPDRLLAPFRREAGLEPRAPGYGNWEGSGLDGHTAGHYLSALAMMVASGEDTAEGALERRLDYMLDELARCQEAYGNGYLGGVPGSRELWEAVAAGQLDVQNFSLNGKWVPWYNIHKTYAGLRDAYLFAGRAKARDLLVRYGEWALALTADLDHAQMQRMLRAEHGGMNEIFADLFAITGDERFLTEARRFNHEAVLDPLEAREDQLTGLHANTQIPKVIGLQRIAALDDDDEAHAGARFFWETVTQERSVAFGGNSVSEHFHPKDNFQPLIEHPEGPETCNTYNMLRLTEQLFAQDPQAAYADYYERALYNHILASIHPGNPGYVYFTPLRPQHYRVYSQPEVNFWCCVGSGMENPAKYGQFIYARSGDDALFVNLFIPSELTVADGFTLRQETAFPDEAQTRLVFQLDAPVARALHLRHPSWVPAGELTVRLNGERVTLDSEPSAYAIIERTWHDGDVVELALPMHTRVERLPDGSDWVALLHGPIVLAAPAGAEDLEGLFADGSRMGHIAAGPMVPLDEVPVLLAREETLPAHVVPDPAAGPLHFRLVDVVEPPAPEGVPLVPFFRLHDQRYQMYWSLTTEEALEARGAHLAAEERARAALEAATLDRVAIGQQQSEVEHDFAGTATESGLFNGRHWRHGERFQYTLSTRGADAVELLVTYNGNDRERHFGIFVNGERIATEHLMAPRPGEFFDERYPIPAEIVAQAEGQRLTVRFVARDGSLAGGVFDLRLLRAGE